MTAPNDTETVVAVVVTRHRSGQLAEGLGVIAKQTRRPDHLVVVDNGPDDATRRVVETCVYVVGSLI